MFNCQAYLWVIFDLFWLGLEYQVLQTLLSPLVITVPFFAIELGAQRHNYNSISQGRRNGFVIGGGGAKKFARQNIFELHFHIKRIQCCTLVNM